jgi:hypothetical protein
VSRCPACGHPSAAPFVPGVQPGAAATPEVEVSLVETHRWHEDLYSRGSDGILYLYNDWCHSWQQAEHHMQHMFKEGRL